MCSILALKQKGVIKKIIGSLPDDPNLALLVWARKLPKYQFNAFVSLCHHLSSKSLTVFVDDVCAMTTMRRNLYEQLKINEEYQKFFGNLGCNVFFTRELLNCNDNLGTLEQVMDFACKIPLLKFLQSLPKHKRKAMSGLDMGELLHGTIELMCFEKLESRVDGIITGELSLAVAMLHRDISNKPLSVIVIPHFKDVASVESYMYKLSG